MFRNLGQIRIIIPNIIAKNAEIVRLIATIILIERYSLNMFVGKVLLIRR